MGVIDCTFGVCWASKGLGSGVSERGRGFVKSRFARVNPVEGVMDGGAK